MCADINFIHAEQLYENEKYSQALDMFKNLDGAENDCDILNYIGCCYLKLGQLDNAKEVFKALIESYPMWARPMYNLGRVYLQQGNTDHALKYLKDAAELSPDDADAYFYLGVCYEKIEDFDNAIKFYKQAIDINYSEFEPHLNLSVCLKKTGDKNKALEEARASFELFDCNDTLYNLTYFLNAVGDYENAFDLLISHNVIDGNDCDLIINLLYCAEKLNKVDLCLKCAKKVSALDPGNIFAKAILKKFEK